MSKHSPQGAWIDLEYRQQGAQEWDSNAYTPEQGFGDGCYGVYDTYNAGDVTHEGDAYGEWEKAALAIAPTLQDGEVRTLTVRGITWELRLAQPGQQ